MTSLQEAIQSARAEGFAMGHSEGERCAREEALRQAASAVLAELRPILRKLEDLAYGTTEAANGA
jgi:flagellar biosynthesis/type III secretory pathway protein FliH